MALWSKTDTLASAPKYTTKLNAFANSNVDVGADTIAIAGHGVATGERVFYLAAAGNTAPAGLTSNTIYWAINNGSNSLKLAANATNAAIGTAIDITDAGLGASHTLQVVPNVFFVDTTEAGVAANRANGLRTPGWNVYETRTITGGATRRRVECLVPMKVTAGDAGDLGVTGNTTIEDATVADS